VSAEKKPQTTCGFFRILASFARARSLQYGRGPPRDVKTTLTAADAGLDFAGPPLPLRPRRALRWLTFLFGGVSCVALLFWLRLFRRPLCLRLVRLLRLRRLPRLVSFRSCPPPLAVPCRPCVAPCPLRLRCRLRFARPFSRLAALRSALACRPAVLRLRPRARSRLAFAFRPCRRSSSFALLGLPCRSRGGAWLIFFLRAGVGFLTSAGV